MSNKPDDPKKMNLINSLVNKIDFRGNKKIPNLQRNLKKYNDLMSKIFFTSYIIITHIAFSIIVVECDERRLQVRYSYIKLKTYGTGNIKIIGEEDFFKFVLPDKRYINNKEANEIKKQYYFDNSGDKINNFTLIWNEELNSIANMFYDCKKIIEIDFSNFNTSLVKDMRFIFRDCESLTSINFFKF